jgi:hypothetical protein
MFGMHIKFSNNISCSSDGPISLNGNLISILISSTIIINEGQKLVEKESGSGNVITEKTELEVERQLGHGYNSAYFNCPWPTGTVCPMDYINFTKEAVRPEL